jgi:hypothetical protein
MGSARINNDTQSHCDIFPRGKVEKVEQNHYPQRHADSEEND